MFRRLLKTAIVFILIASILAVPAFADFATVTGSGVNFREGPGTGYNVIECLPKGTVVSVNGLYNNSWYAVSYNGRDGFISAGYLSMSGGSTNIAVPSADTQSIPANNGNGVIIIGQGYGNTTVQEPPPAPTPTPAPIPTVNPAPSPDVAYGSTGGTIIIGGQRPAASTSVPSPSPVPSAVPSPSPAPSTSVDSSPNASGIKTGMITGDYVRFRTGPSTTYSIINTYNRNTELVILDVSGDWTRCTINGTTGFVFSKYVQEKGSAVVSAPSAGTEITVTQTEIAQAAETVSSTSKAGYISGNNVRFRSAASLSSDIIGEFFFGNAVSITGTSGDWTAVSANGKTGYVYSQYVKEGTYTVQETAPSTPENTNSPVLPGNGALVAAFACTFVGTPYSWGGTDPSTGFDCSGFVYYVYKQFGIELNRVAADQAYNGKAVDVSDLQPGDVLCFYSSGTYIGHSGIYIGDGKFVHAASSTTGVIITSLAGNYSTRGFVARRIVG